MRIEYEGQSYDFDLDDMTVKQALKIEKFIGGPIIDFEKGMAEGTLPALQCIGWLVLHGGDATPIADVDFKVGKFSRAFQAAAKAEAEAAKVPEPDPTAVAAASNGRTSVPVSSLSG